MIISYLTQFAVALLIHELGHLFVARWFGVATSEIGLGWGPCLSSFRVRNVRCKLRAFPIGGYVRLDMAALELLPVHKQVAIFMAGVIVNLIAGYLTLGTFFSALNLILATTNLLPLYQHDGWKCGMVMIRSWYGRKSPLVEWSFTIVGSAGSVALFALQSSAN